MDGADANQRGESGFFCSAAQVRVLGAAHASSQANEAAEEAGRVRRGKHRIKRKWSKRDFYRCARYERAGSYQRWKEDPSPRSGVLRSAEVDAEMEAGALVGVEEQGRREDEGLSDHYGGRGDDGDYEEDPFGHGVGLESDEEARDSACEATVLR